MNFGDELKKYMKELDCSTKDICKISGLSPTLISRYLNNKRCPKADSIYMKNIIDSLYAISQQKGINLSKKSISENLISALNNDEIDYEIFVTNFNTLLDELKISTVDLSKSLGYDTSFISRIKNKERRPADLESFIEKLSWYISNNYNDIDQKQKISSLFGCDIHILNDKDQYSKIAYTYITSSHAPKNDDIEKFLTKLDTFKLSDYVKTDFNKIKIPTTPILLKNSKTFYGVEGRKKAEGEFLKITLLSKSKEPIFFYSNLPILKTGEDETFKKKWILAITMLLKRGLHLNIVHNVDRPLNEMLMGLECWIPVYMTGLISPYYFETPPSNFFLGSHCVSGSVSMSSECLKNNEDKSRFYLTTKKDEVEFAKEKASYMLKKAKPLMKIFKENEIKELDSFMKKQDKSRIKNVEKEMFTNIDFSIYDDEWIMINKKNSPEIHFVIYNKKLISAIKNWIK
ncbi:MAG: helix-turn-helix transcriptional regulator [Clostridia bacterium]|nr:helix-turn-helix transcriptional regulator [Clostridia bacterium]